jgi:hypothetical protein
MMQKLSQKQSQQVSRAGAGLALVLLLSGAVVAPAKACNWGEIFVGFLKTSANMAKEPYEIVSVPFRLHEAGTPTYRTTTTTTTTTPAK